MSENRFSRLISAIGEEKNALLSQKTVAVIGVGGVGGYAVEALARSNIGTIIIMDYDTVNLTNINRQIIALDDTIGLYKVDVFENRINKINPNCKVIKLKEFYDENTKEKLFAYKIDYIIDAFDTIKGKIDLINEAKKRSIPIISSMGMANRFDPTKIVVTTLDKTINDPVARILRKEIKFRLDVVCSLELPIKSDTLASVSYVPPVAGLYLAYYVINTFVR